MDEINEQTENMKQIQDALSAPIGASADFDEVTHLPLRIYNLWGLSSLMHFIPTALIFWQDELEAELEELEGEELENQLLQPIAVPPSRPEQVPANKQPIRPAPQKASAEEDELAALQAEMAIWSGHWFILCLVCL